MKRILATIGLLGLLGLVLAGCPKKEPVSAYDSKLLESAKAAAEEEKRHQAEMAEQNKKYREKKGECSREQDECPDGFLCWDSFFCKADNKDQCSAYGDKRCHKTCNADVDCPSATPLCKEQPMFNGSEQGVMEKICVAKEK
jgi:hypothetical protein